MDDGSSTLGTGRRTAILLTLILAAGLALRLWYLDADLSGARFYDERFSLENVEQLLDTGRLEPRNGYYPLLSYLPQTALLWVSERLHVATGADGLAITRGGRLTGHAYRLARLVQALYGVLSLWLVFVLGRRLFGDAVGLVAATAVAFSPWHVHASGVFKPDVLLVLTVLLAFLLALRAAERAAIGRWAVAGAGVALAMSSKLTGGLTALPLVLISTRPLEPGERAGGPLARAIGRRLLLLALAGAVALALFLVLNPHWRSYLDYMDRLTAEYSRKATRRGIGRWQVPVLTAQFLTESLGVVGVLAAVAAAAVMLTMLLRRRLEPRRGLAWATLLFFPAAYALAYLAKTPQFKANNFLPLLPFVALLAAWGLVAAGRRLASGPGARWPARRLVAAGGAAVALLFVPLGLTYVYRSLTPTSQDLALRFLKERLDGRRNCLVIQESWQAPWPRWESARPFRACLVLTAERLPELGPDLAERSDAVIFRGERLTAVDGEIYLEAVAGARTRQVSLFAPAPFAVRGPAMVVVLHPWSLREPPRELQVDERAVGSYRVEAVMPPEVEAGEVVSFVVRLPPAARTDELPPPRLRMGVENVELIAVPAGRGVVYLSPRLLNRRPGRRVRINRAQLSWDGRPIQIKLFRWQPDPARPSRAQRLRRRSASGRPPRPDGGS